jgi:hypothetical protein
MPSTPSTPRIKAASRSKSPCPSTRLHYVIRQTTVTLNLHTTANTFSWEPTNRVTPEEICLISQVHFGYLTLHQQSVEEQEVTRYWNHRVPRDWYSESVTEWLSRDQITGTAVTLDQWKRHEYSTVRRSWGHEMNNQVHQCDLGTPVQVTYVATGWPSIAGENKRYHEIKTQDSLLLEDDVASIGSRIPTFRYITVSVLIFKGNYYSYQNHCRMRSDMFRLYKQI